MSIKYYYEQDAETRKQIDELWAQEAEDRLEAYERGEIESAPAKKVFDDIDRGKS